MDTKNQVDENACVSCGACCAAFRVSFYWAEAEIASLPAALTEQLNQWLSCMKGTNQRAPHCAALVGDVGLSVSCSIYEKRPSPCREVQPADAQCTKARLRYGLEPLSDPALGSAQG